MSLKMLWSLPLVTVYLYVATVLTTVGYFDYYGLPSYLVEASIQANITYFFTLFNLATAVFGSMRWWTLIIILVLGVLIFLFYHSARWSRWLVTLAVALVLGWALYHSSDFGELLARHNTVYLVPSADCSAFGTSTQSVGIGIYQGKEVFVTADLVTHKQLGGFTLKDLSETSCVFERKNLWQIEK